VQEKNIAVCKETVRSIMDEKDLKSVVKRKFVTTTDSNHEQPVHPNLLNRNFQADCPNQIWAADITYIRTESEWLYLAAVMDLFSRKIVGWAFSTSIDGALVCDALRMALLQRKPGDALLHHSDRGVQYASEKMQDILSAHKIRCSMSRKGDPWDNACMESFFGKLKTEHIRKRVYKNSAQAEQDLFWYIEVFYNRKRRHASLGYVSPEEFEMRAKTNAA
jgi:putative transposase